MKKVPLKKIVVLVALGLVLFMSKGMAQVDKGVTSTGKEVDCSTIDPSVDKTVNEYGKIVTQPRLTRNGKIITDDCGCPVSIDCTNCTDTVNCISITMSAPILSGDVTSAVLQVFSDAGYTTQVGSDITATVSGGKITAVAANLNCYTKYYLRLKLNNNNNCTFDWADSTRDMTMEKVTTCTVASVRALTGGSDLSHEHLYASGLIDSVYDHQGNAYAVVQIGNQCWLKENMRATSSPKGILVSGAVGSSDSKNPLYYDYSTASHCTALERGLLYNWAAAMDTTFSSLPGVKDFPNHRGICPLGWHLPTDSEYKEIEKDYLTEDNGTPIKEATLNSMSIRGKGGGKFTSGCNWVGTNNSGTYPNNYSYADRNISGFSAMPAGIYNGNDNVFEYDGERAYFWTSTSYNTTYTWFRCFENTNEQVYHYGSFRNWAFSVRCVRNAQAKNYCSVNLKLDNENSSVDGRIDSVADHEGNWYKVVEIGEQCWLAENMRATTSPRQGQVMGSLVMNLHNGLNLSQTMNTPLWYDYNTTAQKVTDLRQRGLLYNWSAAFDTITSSSINYSKSGQRGICPSGWHLPTDAEWDLLSSNVINDGKGAGKLAGDYWNSSNVATSTSPGNINYSEHNITGFSAVPVGNYTNGNFSSTGAQTYFWSATSYDANDAWYRYLTYSNENLTRYNGMSKNNGFSVRCLRNETSTTATISFNANGGTGTMDAMNVTTMKDTVLDLINTGTIHHDGNFVFAGWNTMMDGSGDTYDDGAHITPGESMILYAQWDTYCNTLFVREQSGSDQSREHAYDGNTNKIDSVYDHEGNAYGVVQIGDQCWLKENMRARTSPRQGEGAGQVNLKTATSGTNNNAPYYYNSNSSTQLVTDLRDRGYLYNWVAAMDTSYTADSKQPASIDFECRRGICPMGWHLPTDAEWNELEKTSLTENNGITPITDATLALNDFRGKGAGKFTGGCDWNYNGLATSPGNKTNADYNATGFSALPVGFYKEGNFLYSGQQTRFWTASSNATTNAKGRYFQYDKEGVYRDNTAEKKFARSVRCVRDVEITVADIQISKVTCSSVNVATKMLTGNVNNAVNVLVSTQSNFSDTVDVKTLTIPADSILSTDFYDLKTNTTYYVKIADKTANFTTQLCACSVPQTRADNEHVVDGKVYEVQDVDGNWYGVVEIGGQCWTRQNMRCTTSPKTGDRIVTNNYYSTISRSAKWYANDSTTYAKYGLLYNACAALDVTRNATDPAVAASNSATSWAFTAADPVQGICPDGWHLPADSEWTRMENYIVTDGHYNLSLTPSPVFGSQSNGNFPSDYAREGTNTPVSPMLAYLDTWTASNTNMTTASADTNRNKVQFEAKAAGYFPYNSNASTNIGIYGAFWTATPTSNNMFIRQMHNTAVGISRLNVTKSVDISVRCVRGVLIPKVALCGDCDDESIVLKSVTNVDSCALLNSFKEFVTSKKKPEVDSKFAGLAPGKYYLVSTSITGYVTMDSVTLVGRVHIPCVGKPHTGTEISAGVYANNEWGSTVRNEIDSVSDHEGNVYEVVQIGDQCWLRENMRATSSPKNPGVSMVNPLNKTGDQSVQSYVSRIAHYYNNDSTTYAKRYGLLYNWVAAVDTNKSGSPAIATGASTTTWSCPFTVARRGICPLGWHVPSSDEWTTMEDYVLSQYQPEITPNTGNPKATNTALVSILSSGCDWNYVSGVSDSPSDYDNVLRNVSGFSAVPAGCYETTIHDGGLSAQFWKATQNDAKNAGVAVFITSGAGIQDYTSDKHIGRSVRCVRDNE